MKARRKTRRYWPVLVVAIAALFASAGPVAAAPKNPFLGAWETTADGIHARMQFGGGGHFHLRAAPSATWSACEGAPLTLLGTYESHDPGFDIPTVKATVDLYCHLGPDGGRQWFDHYFYFIWYLEETNSLMSTVCWYRPGPDPSACDPG